jgi:tetratricopeptide (TPR) repeat protein
MADTVRAALEEQLGRTLKLQHRFPEALSRLDNARKAHPATAESNLRRIDELRANIMQHMGKFDDAASVYGAMLDRDPLDLEAHLHLNEILYRLRRDDLFLASYDRAAQRAPDNATLPATKGRFLLKMDRPAEAHEKFLEALKIDPDSSAAIGGMARALEALNDHDGAADFYARNLARHSDDIYALEHFSAFLLRRGDEQKAVLLAEQAHSLYPNNQSILAVLGLCYRALGDPREAALNDYGDYVRVFDLDPPQGYTDMARFNHDLAAYLDGLHGDKREYFTQTLRGGTRIFGEVFHNGHRLADLLQPKIVEALKTYVTGLHEPRYWHPLVSRRGHGFRYAGSWSSRLHDCGFHTNHVHTNGWISACYYVAVPDIVEDTAQQQGWIKFGEPTTDFGDRFTLQHSVQPRPGRLVLFPSYMWHGTLPFHSAHSRMTIAFDIIPQD